MTEEERKEREIYAANLRSKWAKRCEFKTTEAKKSYELAEKYMNSVSKILDVSTSLNSLSAALNNDSNDCIDTASIISKHTIGEAMERMKKYLTESSDKVDSCASKASQIASSFNELAEDYQKRQGKAMKKYEKLTEEANQASLKARYINYMNCYSPENQI